MNVCLNIKNASIGGNRLRQITTSRCVQERRVTVPLHTGPVHPSRGSLLAAPSFFLSIKSPVGGLHALAINPPGLHSLTLLFLALGLIEFDFISQMESGEC